MKILLFSEVISTWKRKKGEI